MKLESVEIQATMLGVLWLPACVAWRPVVMTFAPDNKNPFREEWEGMKAALEAIEMRENADFQQSGLFEISARITYRVDSKNTLVKHADIEPCKAIAGYCASEQLIERYFDAQSSFDY